MAELSEIQKRVHATRSERGFTIDALQILAMLIEEVGEVAKAIKPTWSKNYGELSESNLREELADVLVCTLALASCYDIDLENALEEKFFANDSQRVWKSKK